MACAASYHPAQPNDKHVCNRSNGRTGHASCSARRARGRKSPGEAAFVDAAPTASGAKRIFPGGAMTETGAVNARAFGRARTFALSRGARSRETETGRSAHQSAINDTSDGGALCSFDFPSTPTGSAIRRRLRHRPDRPWRNCRCGVPEYVVAVPRMARAVLSKSACFCLGVHLSE